MHATNRWLGRAALLGLLLHLAGCTHGPALTPPPPVEVVISQPVREQIEDWDIYTGTVESKDPVEIRSLIRGEVRKVLFKEGTEIEANKLLFVIDDSPYQADLKQAKGLLLTWEARLKGAEEKIAIYEPLEKKGTIAKEELIAARTNKGEAVGSIETAQGKIMEAEVNIKRCHINSPVAGKIGAINVPQGNIVDITPTAKPLATLIPVDPLYVDFYVSQRALLLYQAYMLKQYERIKKDTSEKEIPVEMGLAEGASFPFKGIVDFADIKVDKNTGTYKVRARFPNPKGPNGMRALTPGLFARVRVAIGDPYSAVLISDRAILSDQSLKYVLVVNKQKNNDVERVDIVQSDRLQPNGLRAVESGLKGDEWIIVEGVNRARPGVAVNPKGAPMARRPLGK